ncbi:MAG: hypothetical protein ACREOZ_02785, partial [Gloeomargaritales cyanobacterium]
MRVTAGGNVGIGTNNPGQPLEVKGNALISSAGGVANQLQLQNPAGTFATTFQSGAQAANINYTLPTAAPPVNGSVLSSTIAGVMSWTAAAAVTGSGAATQIAFWNSPTSLTGNNNLWWDNTNGRLGVGTAVPGQPLEVKGNALISSAGGVANQLQLQNPAGTFATTFQSGAQAANINYTLPLAQGAANTILSNNGAGVLSWSTASGLGIVSGTGSPTQVAFWNSASSLAGNNNLWWDNTNTRLGIGTAAPTQSLEVKSGNVLLSNAGAAGQLQMQGTGTGITTFQAGAQGATNINYTLPTAAPPVNGAALTSTIAGVMSWTAAAAVTG